MRLMTVVQQQQQMLLRMMIVMTGMFLSEREGAMGQAKWRLTLKKTTTGGQGATASLPRRNSSSPPEMPAEFHAMKK